MGETNKRRGEMNYTKGNWTVSNLVISDKEGNAIANIEIQENPESINENITQANANLISASPDMYEALTYFLDFYKYMRGRNENHSNDCLDTMYLKAEKAVLKAEGKL
jgi:hypothetical protein